MSYLSKLVKRITMGRTPAVLFLGIAACSNGDKPVYVPTEPQTRRNSVSSSSVGAVSDLRVSATSDTSATLSFTEVDNGAGLPASYDARVAASPISWGSAASVTRGSCATPVVGMGIGHARNCVVYGLSPLTSYDFRLIAYRGTLNVDASFGALSNVATAATMAKAAVAVASVSLTPSSVAGSIGQSVQFTATAKDAAGNVVLGKVATFASSNVAVLAINASGLATIASAGNAAVVAVIDGKSAQSNVSVAATSPATVTDLRVVAVADTFVTLAFTQVQDGTGAPASYRMRFQLGSMFWNSATDVSRGTCAQPIAGTAVGGMLTCTVFGLTASAAYGFQLVAFRGTLGSVVSGGRSNVAIGTTRTTVPVVASVASVTLSPATFSARAGTVTQYAAALKDANGNVLAGRVITWNTSNASIASVSPAGAVSSLAAGAVTVSATSGGVSGAAALTVSVPAPAPAQTAGFASEPAGLSLLSNYGFTNAIPAVKYGSIANGWQEAYNDMGNASLLSDATAPMSGPSVAQIKYPAGFVGGAAPATLYYDVPQQSQFFAGFEWKVSDPWQGHPSNINKVAFFKFGNDQMALVMYGPPGGPYYLDVIPEFSGIAPTYYRHMAGTPAVAIGQWHKVEMYMNKATGVVKWWMDGTAIGNTVMPFPASGVTEFQFSPTWGGLSDSKRQDDFFWFDHVRLSGAP